MIVLGGCSTPFFWTHLLSMLSTRHSDVLEHPLTHSKAGSQPNWEMPRLQKKPRHRVRYPPPGFPSHAKPQKPQSRHPRCWVWGAEVRTIRALAVGALFVRAAAVANGCPTGPHAAQEGSRARLAAWRRRRRVRRRITEPCRGRKTESGRMESAPTSDGSCGTYIQGTCCRGLHERDLQSRLKVGREKRTRSDEHGIQRGDPSSVSGDRRPTRVHDQARALCLHLPSLRGNDNDGPRALTRR